MLMTLYS